MCVGIGWLRYLELRSCGATQERDFNARGDLMEWMYACSWHMSGYEDL